NILETDFHPKSICEKVSPILSQIGADEELRKYVVPLQQVILTRLFQQLSQVYTDVKLEDVLALAKFPDPFQVSASTIEKFIMNGCKKGDLSIRIDHSTGILTFDQDVFSSSKALHPGSAAGSAEADGSSVQRLQSTPSEIVRTQLSRLSKALYLAVQYVDPSFNEDRQKLKLAALKRAEAGAEKEHMELVSRRDTIQKKKESVASAQAARQREEEQKRKLKQQELQAAETERLAQEAKDRDERRIQAERKRVQREEAEKQLKELKRGVKGVDISGIDIDELDSGRIRMLKLQALEREKNEMSDKLKTTGKRIDHLERAYRREEIKHLGEDYAAQREKDQKSYEAFKNETLQTAEQKHKEDVAIKHRLSRLVPTYESFKKTITNQRHADFEKRRRAAERELEQKMEQRRRDVREQKAAERRRAQEEERFRREEEERAAREAEEAERAAEEKKQKDAEAKAEAGAEKEHMELVSRRDTIQKKKESVASAQAARQREEEQKRKLKQQELQAAETERLAQEAKDRDERRIQAERKRVQREEAEKQLKELKRGVKGVDISGIDIDELDSGRIRMLKLQALEREKNEMSDKLKTTGKRIDHLERAYRREEIKHLGEDYAAQREKDQKSYEAFKNETLQTAEQKHKEDVAIKHRLSRLVPTYESFKKTITNQRHADFEKRRRAAERELEQKMEQRRRDVREQKAAERRRAQEEERFRREEEERAAREAEEAERAAEEKKQKDAEAKAEAESRRQERAEAARKQMEREAEAERKMKERKMGGGAPSAAPARSFEGMRRGPAEEAAPAPSAGGPPRLALQGQSGKPSWREREAMRQSGQLPAESAAPPVAPAADARVATEETAMPKRSGYIPPALRGNASGAGESMPSEPPKER
ncbi:Eukaryotic translation initiation factor 3 subunit, partial [Hortaea werneckii]